MLNQIEMNNKKTLNNNGLAYISKMIPFCLHDGDPLTFFKIDEFSK